VTASSNDTLCFARLEAAFSRSHSNRTVLPPSQTWRTFLTNHIDQIVAADVFIVPTVTYRLLFVLVSRRSHRRLSTNIQRLCYP